VSDFPRQPPSPRRKGASSRRGLLTASVTLSGIAVVCLVWWLVDDTRSWWAAGAGAIAAFAGVALGAWGRRALPGDDKEGGR
jgi:uncharacterized membrane protein YfcA